MLTNTLTDREIDDLHNQTTLCEKCYASTDTIFAFLFSLRSYLDRSVMSNNDCVRGASDKGFTERLETLKHTSITMNPNL